MEAEQEAASFLSGPGHLTALPHATQLKPCPVDAQTRLFSISPGFQLISENKRDTCTQRRRSPWLLVGAQTSVGKHSLLRATSAQRPQPESPPTSEKRAGGRGIQKHSCHAGKSQTVSTAGGGWHQLHTQRIKCTQSSSDTVRVLLNLALVRHQGH